MAHEIKDKMNGLEEFLRESSEEFEMIPSEQVWTSIHNELHTTPKWPYYTLAIIFITLGLATHFNQNQKNQPAGSLIAKRFDKPVSSDEAPSSLRDQRITTLSQINDVIKQKSESEISLSTISTKKNQQIIVSNISGTNKNNIAASVPTATTVTLKKYDLAVIDWERNELSISNDLLIQQPRWSFYTPAKKPEISSEKATVKSNYKLAIHSKKPSKNAWSFYISPAMSYRSLHGSAQAFNNFGYSRTDVNTAVKHLPMIGMELGSAMIFNAQRKIRFRLGIQFNLNQYDIRAYNAVPEVTSLSVSGIGQTPIKTIAFHRNFDGFKETWLKNKHIMISIPMATELRVMGDQKLSLNIAAGIQPTYMLSENPYLISSNLKNYAKAPSGLLRDFNINGSMETFISLKSGSIRWTMGPQFRYQLFSNFKKTYPFTEHLTDFGFKMGLIKSF